MDGLEQLGLEAHQARAFHGMLGPILEAAGVGALGIIAGAFIAFAGTFLAEWLRQRSDRRRWQFDQRLQLFAQMVDLTQAARNNSYEVTLGQKDRKVGIYGELSSLRTRVQLLASGAAVEAMSTVEELTHNDEHAAELAIARRDNPSSGYRSGRDFQLSDFDHWRDMRDRMQNAFRADLGLPPVKVERREAFPAHENDVF